MSWTQWAIAVGGLLVQVVFNTGWKSSWTWELKSISIKWIVWVKDHLTFKESQYRFVGMYRPYGLKSRGGIISSHLLEYNNDIWLSYTILPSSCSEHIYIQFPPPGTSNKYIPKPTVAHSLIYLYPFLIQLRLMSF